MALQIHAIDMLHVQDDWNWVLRDEEANLTAVIDPSEANGVQAFLQEKGWGLDVIFNTHHHWDHTNGNPKLKQQYGCTIVGGARDAERIRGIDVALEDGESYPFAGREFMAMDVSGHTIGHIAFYCATEKLLFTGDALFAMGCGRMFEGDAEMFHNSLQKLAALPDDTWVYAAHEYTIPNGRFARSVEPDNDVIAEHIEQAKAKRRQKLPSLPSNIGLEKATNPFLRTQSPSIRQGLGLGADVADYEVFAALRHAKDQF